MLSQDREKGTANKANILRERPQAEAGEHGTANSSVGLQGHQEPDQEASWIPFLAIWVSF